MDKNSIEKMLEMVSREDLIDIITGMVIHNQEADRFVMEWCEKNLSGCESQAISQELQNLWVTAQEIISEFNLYGGGSESDEDEAVEALWQMNEIVRENEISWDIRLSVLDEMLAEFYTGNSGFDDMLIEVAESFCKGDAEKRYLADALVQGTSSYYKNYGASIYSAIGDENKFLETKLSNLRYGSDYVDVANYYDQHGERQKAIKMIWKGLKETDGRLDELVSYVAPIYIKEKMKMNFGGFIS